MDSSTPRFGFSDLLTLGKEPKVAYSFLLYLGILTRDQNNHGLRVPNLLLRFGVLERIVELLKVDKSIHHLITPAFNSLVEGDTKGLAELLRKFVQTRSIRSLIGGEGGRLQSVVEIILDKPSVRVPELPLVMDASKQWGDGNPRRTVVGEYVAVMRLLNDQCDVQAQGSDPTPARSLPKMFRVAALRHDFDLLSNDGKRQKCIRFHV